MKILMLFLAATLFGHSSFAKVKPNLKPLPLKTAIKVMRNQATYESMVKLLASRMTNDDKKFFMEVVLKSGRDLKKPLPVKLLNDKIVIKDLGVLQVRLGGKEITFRNQVFKYNSKLSYKKNVLAAAKQLGKFKSKSKSKSASIWINEAHAEDGWGDGDDPASQQYNATVAQANEVVMTMKYINDIMKTDAEGIGTNAQARLLGSDAFVDKFNLKGYQLESIVPACGEPKSIMVAVIQQENGKIQGTSQMVYTLQGSKVQMTVSGSEGGYQEAAGVEEMSGADELQAAKETIELMCNSTDPEGIVYDTYWKGYLKNQEQKGTAK